MFFPQRNQKKAGTWINYSATFYLKKMNREPYSAPQKAGGAV